MKIKLINDSAGIIGNGGFYFTPLPPEIHFKRSSNYQSFNIISKGRVDVPKGTEVDEISWEGEFFGEAKKEEYIVDTDKYMEPNNCVSLINKLISKNAIVTLIISETWINLDVTIASFEATPFGAFGNIKYSITFKRYKDLKIKTTKDFKNKKGGSNFKKGSTKKKTIKTRNNRKNNKNSNTSYSVRSGDTLIGIARTQGLGAEKWTVIYEKNKKVIEEVAKKHGLKNSSHGHWIYPGTKLEIPK